MNTFCTIITSFALLLSFQLSAQVENAIADLNFKLKLMDDNTTWGVYVVPGESIKPTKRSNTGAGQVTIVTPAGFSYIGLENFGGTWVENARVDSPMEAPNNTYISFGFVSDEPRIKYFTGKETLLFTFIPEDATAIISLIDNVNDPFATPNTYGSNPGNDLGVLDFGHAEGTLVYNYGTNLETENKYQKAIFTTQKPEENKQNNGQYKVLFASDKIVVPSN
jgi:hypothetical protein